MLNNVDKTYENMINGHTHEMPVLKTILEELDMGGWKIKSGKFLYDDTEHEQYRIIANPKRRKPYKFKTITICLVNDPLVFVQTECISSIKEEDYIYAIQLSNVACFNPTGIKFGINPKNNRVTSFVVVPYDNYLRDPIPIGIFFRTIIDGMNMCRDLVKAIEKRLKDK
jgi:hypothetical protein